MVPDFLYQVNSGKIKGEEKQIMTDEPDNIEEFEAKETSRKLPMGWLVLFWALILWGVFYFVSYTPGISGWSQEKEYEESVNPVRIP